jgi:ATP-dependent protease ClpP protease subunit
MMYKKQSTGKFSTNAFLGSLGGTGMVQRSTSQKDIIRITFAENGIDGVSDHLEELDALRSAGAEDLVLLYFSGCPGGSADIGMALMNAIIETPAHTVAILEGHNGSLATIIPMVCSEVVVTPYTSFMCHTGHGGDYGTIQNKARSAVFAEKNLHAWMEDVYEGFLSAEEIKEIQRGGEIYLNAEEIEQRFAARGELLANEQSEEGVVVDEQQ